MARKHQTPIDVTSLPVEPPRKAAPQDGPVLDRRTLSDVADVVAAAKEVFGREGGLRWLGTPVPALGYATPITLADTPAGREQIHRALVNLAHGNW